MQTNEWIVLFSNQVKETPVLEWVAIFFAIAEVLLAKSNKVLLYPAGIISTAIYMWLFIRPGTRLYADAILNSYYLIMSIYGWLLWSGRKNNAEELQISYCSKREWLIVIVFILAGWLLLYLMLTRLFILFPGYIPADVALWDAFVSASAWAGMWLLAKRKIENWLILNVSNIAAIPLLLYKGMPFTGCLTLFLFIVAIFGYIEWRKLYHTHRIAA